MFIDCSSLKTVILENTVEIGGNAFNRTIITSVIIPSTVTTVGDYAFKECKSLTKVVILGSMMGSYMFYGCSALNTLVLTERFVTFGSSALGSAPSGGTFITYYTGADYERIKTLGSSTSRFKSAKCYSYSDYVENDYTDQYKIIYDTNLCDAAFGGAHTEPKDDGDCSTAVVCSVCSEYTYKEAKNHVMKESLTYSSFDKEGQYRNECTNEGCTYGTTTKADALFTYIGCSTPVSDRDGMVIGYMVNHKAISEYERITQKTIGYGVFAVSKFKLDTNDIFGENGKVADGAITVEITERSYSSFEFKLTGFNDDNKDKALALGAYVAATDKEGATEYSYLQQGTPAEGAKYVFMSYTEYLSLIKA